MGGRLVRQLEAATVARAAVLVVVHPRPGLESSPGRSLRPRPKWRRAAKRVGGVLFAGGGVPLRWLRPAPKKKTC